MRHAALILLFGLGSFVLDMSNYSFAQTGGDKELLVQQEGPDPLFGAPESLDQLIKRVPAAVVAEIVGPGDLRSGFSVYTFER
jgi:hypothetical protein